MPTAFRKRLAACAVALGAVLVLASCGAQESGQASASAENGKILFQERCGSCHTLADAGTSGQIGPNLDWGVGYSKSQGFDGSTLFSVVLGQIRYPRQGSVMQPDLVTGQDAVDVAAYVAAAADPEAAPAGAEGGGEATDGKAIFQQNCGSCHTLADAGTSGTIGPNLDETQPSVELAVDRVTNGKGAMPAFGGTLSEEQIQAVSDYVASAAGG